jgi:hypothetical protein
LAVANGTGAEAEMQKRRSNLVMDDDYVSAAAVSFTRASRYESTYAYRDYLALLHVLDTHPNVARFRGSRASVPEFAAHLGNGNCWSTTSPRRLMWTSFGGLHAPITRAAKSELYRYPVIHLVRSATMDRVPSETLIAAVDSMDAPVVTLSDEGLFDSY